MTDERQRIAIATACGWKFGVWSSLNDSVNGWYSPSGRFVGHHGHLPDYLNSLDAMHEAEKTLDEDQSVDYANILDWVCEAGAYSSHFAAALQRAEAFLRAVGRWEE